MSDQDRVSPYNIRKIMMRIEKIINWELLVDSRPNLQSNLKGLYCRQKGELLTNKVFVLSLIQSHFSDNYLNKLQQISKICCYLLEGQVVMKLCLLCDWELYGHYCPWNRAHPDYTLPWDSCHHCNNKILEWVALTFL